MRLFPAPHTLVSVVVDMLGPLPKTEAGNRSIPVMADRFTKLTKVIPLKHTTGLEVAKAFLPHWVFKYGPPKEVMSHNGPQFASKIYQNTCRILGIWNTFMSA